MAKENLNELETGILRVLSARRRPWQKGEALGTLQALLHISDNVLDEAITGLQKKRILIAHGDQGRGDETLVVDPSTRLQQIYEQQINHLEPKIQGRVNVILSEHPTTIFDNYGVRPEVSDELPLIGEKKLKKRIAMLNTLRQFFDQKAVRS